MNRNRQRLSSMLTMAFSATATLHCLASPTMTPLLSDSQSIATSLSPDSIDQSATLQEIVVTGTLTPKLLKDSPVLTRLISAKDIRNADASNLQDLLQAEIPGVEFSYAMNQQTNMNLSGFAGQSILVLIDGERLAGETMDNTDFSRLVMNNVKRIEIVKGASSALYGSNASGGVINIITKEAEKKWQVNLNSRAADHGDWRAGLSASGKFGRFANTLGADFHTAKTFTVCLTPDDGCDFRKVYGFKTWNFNDKLTYRPTDAIKLIARAGYYFKERYYSPDTPDRYRDFNAGLKGQWSISDFSSLLLSYSFDQYDKSDFLKTQSRDVRDYRNVQNALRALFSHRFRNNITLTAGADLIHDWLDTYQFGPEQDKSQNCFDAFAQADYIINSHWEIIGALRYDYFSDFSDSNISAKASGCYRLGDVAIRAGYAGGFRAPTLKERYMNFDMAGIFDIHGNQNLKPEKSHNLNLSAEYSLNNYQLTAAANYSFINSKIATSGIMYQANGNPFIQYMNVDHLKVFSADITLQAHWNHGLSARISYAYTHEQTAGTGAVNQYCPARPHALNIRGAWHKRWAKNYTSDLIITGRLLSKVSYQSMYLYEPFETRTITNPAYTIWKLQLNQTICRGITITLAVDNLFNYQPAIYSFNAPITTGANLQAGFSIDLDRLF